MQKSAEEIEEKAKQMWESMDDNERHGIRFGMFPAKLMEEAQAEGFSSMAVPLMDIATKNGGMRA